jgi:hypothetical protein
MGRLIVLGPSAERELITGVERGNCCADHLDRPHIGLMCRSWQQTCCGARSLHDHAPLNPRRIDATSPHPSALPHRKTRIEHSGYDWHANPTLRETASVEPTNIHRGWVRRPTWPTTDDRTRSGVYGGFT